MDYDERKMIKEDIKNIRSQNMEEILMISKYCLIAYVKSAISFGFEHKVTRDVLNVWIEFFKNIKEEANLLKFLLKNACLIDYEEVDDFIFEMDALNEEIYNYYCNVLNDIEDASSMRMEWKATRSKKDFESLIDSDKYRDKVRTFLLTEKDVETFLGYPKEFWDYIDDRTYIVDSRFEEESCFYGVNMKMDGDILVDVKVFVPEIVDLKTALVNVHELKHAYDLYGMLGRKIDRDDSFYEENARELEKRFETEYMPNIYGKPFGRKKRKI